jgi:hypothetical protein
MGLRASPPLRFSKSLRGGQLDLDQLGGHFNPSMNDRSASQELGCGEDTLEGNRLRRR